MAEEVKEYLEVVREQFGRGKDGSPSYNFSVRGPLRDGDLAIARLVPVDSFAYHTMKYVFGGDSKIAKAELRHKEVVNRDDNNNRRVTHQWSAAYVDPEDGFVYELPLKCVSRNDEAVLVMLLQKHELALAKQRAMDEETAE